MLPARQNRFHRGIAILPVGRERERRVECRRDPSSVVHRPSRLPEQIGNVHRSPAIWQLEFDRFADKGRARTARLSDKDHVGEHIEQIDQVLRGGKGIASNDHE